MKREKILEFLTRPRGELSKRAIYTAVALTMNCGGFAPDLLSGKSDSYINYGEQRTYQDKEDERE